MGPGTVRNSEMAASGNPTLFYKYLWFSLEFQNEFSLCDVEDPGRYSSGFFIVFFGRVVGMFGVTIIGRGCVCLV